MRVIKQSAQILVPETPMKHIEKIGRICYKSEDKIGDDTDRKFVKILFNNKHHAMLEHYRFIMQISPRIYDELSRMMPKHFEFSSYDRCLISFNARALMELDKNCNGFQFGYLTHGVMSIKKELIGHIVKKYNCYELFGLERDEILLLSSEIDFIENNPDAMSAEEWKIHGWMSVHMITDRGISHEIVRHREETSFAQESTRYCNYGQDKFGSEITIINYNFGDSVSHDIWLDDCLKSERIYFQLLNRGIKPQIARAVLPTCLKTEIVMTAPIYEWDHFFDLRYKGTTGSPHPMMKELAEIIYTLKEAHI